MKTIFFLILFLSVPFLVFSQAGTITLPNVAYYYGAIRVDPLAGGSTYYTWQPPPSATSSIEIGNIYGEPTGVVGANRGRGFLLFNVGSTANELDTNLFIGAKLYCDYFDITHGITKAEQTIKFSKLSKSSLVMDYGNAQTAYSELGSSSNVSIATLSIFADTINHPTFSINIPKKYISNAQYVPQGFLPICVVQSSDDTKNGIEIKNARLVINYYLIPSAPSNLKVVTGSLKQNECTLSWGASSGPPTEYRVYQAGSSGYLTSKTTSIKLTGLTPNTLYNYYVRAWNPAGYEDSNPISFTTPDIYGASYTVCYEGSKFTLLNPPAGNITWTVDGPFTPTTGSDSTFTIYRTESNSSNGTLKAFVNGTEVASKIITPCPKPSISGPSFLCPGSTVTFTVSNAPLGYSWGCSSNLMPVLGSPGKFKASSVAGNGYVSINVGNTQLVKNDVKIGNGADIIGPNSIIAATTTNYYADPICSNVTYSWKLYKYNYNTTIGEGPVWKSGVSSVTLLSTAKPDNVNPFILELYANNVLVKTKQIQASWYYLSFYNNGSIGPIPIMLSYPNPVSDVLNIEIDEEEITKTKSLEQTAKVAKTIETVYDIRLYDGQGNLLRQTTTKGGKIQFNVSNLPNGIYYLHVYDGVSETPEIRQIMVER